MAIWLWLCFSKAYHRFRERGRAHQVSIWLPQVVNFSWSSHRKWYRNRALQVYTLWSSMLKFWDWCYFYDSWSGFASLSLGWSHPKLPLWFGYAEDSFRLFSSHGAMNSGSSSSACLMWRSLTLPGSTGFAVSQLCCISVRRYAILSIVYHLWCLRAVRLFIVGDWTLLRWIFFIAMRVAVEWGYFWRCCSVWGDSVWDFLSRWSLRVWCLWCFGCYGV